MPSAPKSRKNSRSAVSSTSVKPAEKQALLHNLTYLRDALSSAPLPEAVYLAEDCGEGENLIPAAVLFPIVLRDEEPAVLLTQRNPELKDHPGQISFPGGRVEAKDKSPADTALREAEEEIGLDPACVEIVGYLPAYRTVTGFHVIPVVAFVTPPLDIVPDPGEVAEVFEVPLSFLLDLSNHQQQTIHFQGSLRRFYAVPYGSRFIWGATAGMIHGLARLLSTSRGRGDEAGSRTNSVQDIDRSFAPK